MNHGPRVVSDGFLSREELAGQRVLVLGLGVSGRAVASALAQSGATVLASDAEPSLATHPEVQRLRELGVEVECGGHRKAARWLQGADLVVPSPGLSPRTGILADAIAEGVPVLSEIELAFRFTPKPVVAVTGTNGKTTTCRLVGEMLAADGRRAVVCGNIGNPFITAALEHPDAELFVVEVSSFQLTFCYAFHPHVAIITNLAPDHLDWHGSMAAYRVAKSRVAARQTRNDWFVYPANQPDLADLAPTPGPRRVVFSTAVVRAGDAVWLEDSRIAARIGSDVVVEAGSVERLARRGLPLVEDALAAAGAALAFGASPEAVARALESFEPDHHRVEPVGEVDGVWFVDDSKATNPHATLAALRSFGPRQVVLIAGGRNKGLDLRELRRAEDRLRGVVAVGEAAQEILQAFADSGVPLRRATTMREAVGAAFELAAPDGVVLLSPACASFDQYEGYAKRGEAFQEAVRELARARGATA